MPKVVTLASGCTGEVRAILVEDANKMSNASLLHDLRHVLRDAFKVIDPGIYKEPFDWSSMYFCDRFEVMMQCSILTHRDVYRFRYPCKNPDNPCRHKDGGDRPHPIPWRLNLSELARKPLPEATRQQLMAGVNRFEAMAVMGEDWDAPEEKVVFQLLDEKTEVATTNKLESGMGRTKRQRVQIRSQIIQIGDLTDPVLLDRRVDSLNSGMLAELRDKMDAVDGGVQTFIKISCDRCGWEEPIDLPLGGLFRKRMKEPADPVVLAA